MKKLLVCAVPVLVILAALAGCSALQPAISPGDLGALTRQLDARMPKWLEQYRVPGAAVALVRNGDLVWSRGYGVANEAQNVPVTSDTVFRSASISKAVTAWGVMRLVEEGKLDLDSPVEQYLTRWHLPSSRYDARGVTIRRLLSHTAGLSSHVPRGLPAGQKLPSLEESLSGSRLGTSPVRLAMEPGVQYSYTGGGYTLLQLIIEEVTGESFAGYMQHAVLDPLGMNHSSFEWRADLRPATAVGYDGSGKPYSNDVVAEQAAAGLYTTAPDLARFVAAGMTGSNGEPAGRAVLSPESVDLMFAPVAEMQGMEALSKSAVGLGHFIEILPDGTKAVTHNGTNWGWQLIFMSVPERGDGIVVLTNGTRGVAVYAEVLGAWGTWVGAGLPRVARAYQDLRSAVFGLAGVFGLGLIFPVWRLIKQVRAGRRRWLWQFSAKPGIQNYAAFAASMLIAGLVTVGWFLVAHPVLTWLISRLAYWLTLAVLSWCVYVAVSALLRPAPPRC